MRTGVGIQLSPEDRARLERLVADRNTPQKHVWRAQIVLLSGDGVGTMEIVRRSGQSKPTVWRWQWTRKVKSRHSTVLSRGCH